MRDMQIRRGRTFGGERPDVRVGRSQFNRSFGRKMTFDASYLYPLFVDEVLPGDTFTLKMSGLCRVFSPLEAPIMDNITVETFFFFVPNRLVWAHWVDFMGEHDASGAQDTTYTVPVLNSGVTVDHDNDKDKHSFAAYFGLPDGLQTGSVDVNALPFRGFNLIYNEWFRDQNILNLTTVTTGDGPDDTDYYTFRRSAKKHDYFTSALPYLQKGTAEAVALQGSEIEVRMKSGTTGDYPSIYADDAGQYRYLEHSGVADERVDVDATQDATGGDKLYVDLTDGSVDIWALRESIAIQAFLETEARSGTRYVEKIKAHFGVTSPGLEIGTRPEYLGGGKSYINVSPVAATTGTLSATSPESADQYLGELRGVAAGMMSGHGFAKSFTEHGYVIGIIRARGDLTYFNGLDRMWSRSSLYDFYFPAFANLGEQSILNKELFVKNDGATTDDDVFGYQERWAEYRFKHSQLVGLFNSNATGKIDFWHLAEDFSDTPTLGQTFIEDQTPMVRVTTFDTGPDFMADLWFDYKCARPLPVYSIPTLMGTRF